MEVAAVSAVHKAPTDARSDDNVIGDKVSNSELLKMDVDELLDMADDDSDGDSDINSDSGDDSDDDSDAVSSSED